LLAEAGRRPGVANASFANAADASGRVFAIGDYDGNVWLWDSRSDEPAKRLALDVMGERDGSVSSLALSPDGSTLAVSDSFVLLWDVHSRKPLGLPFARESDGASIRALVFSPDGRVLASSDAYALKLWEGVLWHDLDDLREQVCSLVAGDLSRDEWASITPAIAYRKTCG
jgi:WD40 repeat protein